MYNKHDLSNFFAELGPRFQIREEYFFNFGGVIHIVMATDIKHFKLQMLTFSSLLSYTMSKTINEAMICSVWFLWWKHSHSSQCQAANMTSVNTDTAGPRGTVIPSHTAFPPYKPRRQRA